MQSKMSKIRFAITHEDFFSTTLSIMRIFSKSIYKIESHGLTFSSLPFTTRNDYTERFGNDKVIYDRSCIKHKVIKILNILTPIESSH